MWFWELLADVRDQIAEAWPQIVNYAGWFLGIGIPVFALLFAVAYYIGERDRRARQRERGY